MYACLCMRQSWGNHEGQVWYGFPVRPEDPGKRAALPAAAASEDGAEEEDPGGQEGSSAEAVQYLQRSARGHRCAQSPGTNDIQRAGGGCCRGL